MFEFEEAIRRVVREEIALALAERPEPPREWFTSAQAGEYLGLSRGTIHNLVSSGALPRRGESGRKLWFSREDLDRFVEARS